MKRRRQNSSKLQSGSDTTEADLEVNKKKKNIKSEGMTKNKKNEATLKDFYKLEIDDYKKETKVKHNKTSQKFDLINDDYENIKKISEQVRKHVKLNKCLLRTRILMQKVLALANKLPLFPFVAFTEQIIHNKNLDTGKKDILYEVKINEQKIKNNIAKLLITLHMILKTHFLKCNIPVNEKEADRIDVIYDEEDKPFYEKRRKLYNENTNIHEKKLFSVIDTWLPYSKKMCLNYFDIMHKITKISSVKTLKTYEQSISSQVHQAMLDLPSTIENCFPPHLNHNIIGEKFYELIFKKDKTFRLNKHIYDDEIYYKKFLINAIQTLKENQEDIELLKSQKEIYKIKKYDNKNKRKKEISFEPIPKLVNYMEPDRNEWEREGAYDYMDNPGFVDIILSSLFQQQ